MKWSTDHPTLAELQTLEYALEYGGEGASHAIIRTNLSGRVRYWELNREYDFDSENGELYPTECSKWVFLSYNATDALNACQHQWWTIMGVYVAPDLLPIVEAILAAHKVKLEDWLNPIFSEDHHAFSCSAMWPDCDLMGQPVDAFWLTARPETMRRALGGLSESQIRGILEHPTEDVGVLVDRRGRVFLTAGPEYPMEYQDGSDSPFHEFDAFRVTTFSDLWLATKHLDQLLLVN